MSASFDRDQPRVLISVLNWNQFEMTLACLRSLEKLVYPAFKVVVVDNGSRTFPEAELTDAFPAVNVIRSSSNLGYAGGHKLAVDYAFREQFDLIWLLNNDAFVKHDTLSELVNAYLEFGDGIYGSVQLLNDSSGKLAPWTYVDVDAWGRPDFSRVLQLSGRRYDEFFGGCCEPRRIAKVSGSSMLIPLSVVRRHGFIKESFFLYSEEADYCLALHREGVPSVLVPRSLIFHNHLSSSKNSSSLLTMLHYYQTRNNHVVARRYRGRRQFANLLVSDLRRFSLLLLVTLRRNPRGFMRSAAYFHWRGLIDAYTGRMGKRFAPEDYLN